MQIGQHPVDLAYKLRLERAAHCCGECNKRLQPGTVAWSYLLNPVDGNYVECSPCRYGADE